MALDGKNDFEYSNPLEDDALSSYEPISSKKEMAIRQATTEFANDPTSDVTGAYLEAYEADPIITMANQVGMAKEAVYEGTALAIDQMAGEEPETLNAAGAGITDLANQAAQDYDTELGPELAYIDSLGLPVETNQEREEAATQMWLRRQIAEVWDKGLWGTLTSVDGLTAMLLPIHSYSTAQFMEKLNVGGEENLFENFLATDGLVNLADRFEKLTPRQKVLAYKQMKEAAVAATDNELEQMFILLSATGQTPAGTELQQQYAEKVDIGFLGTSLGTKLASILRRTTSTIRNTRRLSDVTATLADVASRSDDAADAIGVTRLDAATSSVPVRDMEIILDGAAPEVASDIQRHWETADRLFQQSKDFAREGIPLTPSEQLAYAQKKAKQISERQDVTKVAFRTTDKGVDFKYVARTGEDTGEIIEESLPYTLDAVTGGFVTDSIPLMAKVFAKVVSPNTSLQADRKFFVDTFTRVLGPRAKIRSTFQKTMENGLKGVKTEGLEKLDIILKKGTLNDEVYSYRDLVKGGRPDLPQLTEKEFRGYAAMRQIADNGWEMANEDLFRQLQARGNKTVQIGEQSAYARVYDSSSSAKQAYNSRRENYVWTPDEGRIASSLTPEKIDDMYSRGYRLTYLDEPSEFWASKGENLKFAFVKENAVRALDPVVLNRRKGYMPLIYKDAYYFVKEEVPLRVDGKTRAMNQTLRYFDSISEAEKYVQKLESNAENAGRKFKVLRDREMDVAEREADIVNIYGGKYRSARAKERIKFGPDGAEASFVSPLEALGQYYGNLSTRYPISELKLALQERWMNQASKYLGHDIKLNNFNAARGIVAEKLEDTLVRDKLITAHDQVTQMASIMSKEERDMSNMVKSLAEKMDRGGHAKLAQGLYRIDQADPIQFAKSAAFNTLLGLFSPAQFLVQAMGSTVAMSISPTHAPRAFGRMLGTHALDLATNPAIKASTLKRLEKLDPEMAEFYNAWERSGLFDSVVSAQGDFRIAASGLPVTKSMMTKFFEKGRLFFEQGELVNSRMSFGIAYGEWKEANKGRKLDDVGLKQILTRTERFKLNMSQSNRAWFQKGWQSIPFQFQQVATKSVEALLGSHLTASDKIKLVTGQLAIFGAAGIPFGGKLVDNALSWSGAQPEDLDPDTIRELKEGMLGNMLDSAGLDVEVATRFGNLNAVEESLVRFFSGDYSIGELASGAAGGVWGRVFGFGSHQNGFLENMLFAGKVITNADEISQDDAVNMVKYLGVSLAEIPTSTRNLIGGYMMFNSQAMLKGNGQPLWTEDISVEQALAKAFGFSPKSVGDYYKAQDISKAKQSLKRNYVNLSVNMINKMAMAWDEDDAAGIRATGLVMNMIDNVFADDPEALYQLREAVVKELLSGTEPKHEFIRKMIIKQINNGDAFSSASEKYSVDVIEALHPAGE